MTKLAPEWVRTSDPVIRSPSRYRWTTAPALHGLEGSTYVHQGSSGGYRGTPPPGSGGRSVLLIIHSALSRSAVRRGEIIV